MGEPLRAVSRGIVPGEPATILTKGAYASGGVKDVGYVCMSMCLPCLCIEGFFAITGRSRHQPKPNTLTPLACAEYSPKRGSLFPEM